MTAESDTGALRALARRAWEAALERVEPRAAVRRALASRAPPAAGAVVLGFGKAGLGMLEGAHDAWGDSLRGGLVVVPAGQARVQRVGAVRVVEAAHPVPDERSVRHAAEIVAHARGLPRGTLALVLVSGGGSSLVASPPPGVSLADFRDVTGRLLLAGADIHEINVVRKHLSTLHGGRLAAAAPPSCRTLSVLISDVPGDDPSSIASGPTVADPTSHADALDVLQRRLGDDVPRTVREHLERGRRGEEPESPKPDGWPLERHEHVLAATNGDALEAGAAELRAAGARVIEHPGVTGDAASCARRHVEVLTRAARDSVGLVAHVAGGETTVVVTGAGRGGRNQHAAAVAAGELETQVRGGQLDRRAVFAAIATDGRDGPTDAAGGLVDAGTWPRVRATGGRPEALVDDCDSHELLRAAGDLVVTGPTGTNVMDLHFGLVAARG